MDIKTNQICSIVTTELKRFNVVDTEYKISQKVMDDLKAATDAAIGHWKGVNTKRTKKDLSSFRKYFVIGKNWWDHTKNKVMGPLWLQIFADIERVKSCIR